MMMGHPYDHWDPGDDCDQVWPGVWVGGADCDPGFPITRLCLHEDPEAFRGGFRIPICIPTGDSKQRIVSRRLLNAAADIIQDHVKRGVPILVHCWSGIERSPLAVAWWMKRHGHMKSLRAAYTHLQEKRPFVQDRTHWLGPKEDGR